MVKPSLVNKGFMSNDFISIRNGDAFIDKESELVEMFDTHHINPLSANSRKWSNTHRQISDELFECVWPFREIDTQRVNILEKASDVPPKNYVIDPNNTQEIIEELTRKYERQPSILKIKNKFDSCMLFDFTKA